MTNTKIEFGFGYEINRDGERLTLQQQASGLAAVKRAAAGLYSAFTLVGTEGAWTNPAGKLVCEKGATLFVVVPRFESHEDEAKVHVLVGKIKEYLYQEAVAVTFTSVNFSIH